MSNFRLASGDMRIFRYSTKTQPKLIDLAFGTEYSDILDLKDGRDVRVSRKGTTIDTDYSITPPGRARAPRRARRGSPCTRSPGRSARRPARTGSTPGGWRTARGAAARPARGRRPRGRARAGRARAPARGSPTACRSRGG